MIFDELCLPFTHWFAFSHLIASCSYTCINIHVVDISYILNPNQPMVHKRPQNGYNDNFFGLYIKIHFYHTTSARGIVTQHPSRLQQLQPLSALKHQVSEQGPARWPRAEQHSCPFREEGDGKPSPSFSSSQASH